MYYKKGLPDLAILEFKASSHKDPKNAAFVTHLGLAYAKTGEFTLAKDALKKGLSADPNAHASVEAREALKSLGS